MRETTMTQILGPEITTTSVDFALVQDIVDKVNDLIDQDAQQRGRRLGRADENQLAMARTMDVIVREGAVRARQGLDMWSEVQEKAIRDAVLDSMFRLGRIQKVVDMPLVEDVYIAGTRPAHVRLSDGSIVECGVVADSNEELIEQLRIIATHGSSTERQMVSSRPIIDMRLPDGQRAAGIWDVVPEPHLTIRCHRYVDITLEKLIGMGMVSRSMANFLYAAVRGRRSILVIGVPGAGKTTLLRSLAQCVDRYERFASLETEYELFLHKIFDTDKSGVTKPRYPLLVPMEARPGTGETGPNGRPAGEMSVADLFPASLRHSLQRLLIGEMRGEEIVPTLMAMARGYRGSMASFHANSSRKAFTSLQSAVTFYAHNVSAHAAMSLVADALDLIVFVDREDTAAGTIRYVSEILEVHELSENGLPASTPIYGPDPAREDVDPRGYPLHQPEGEALWARRAGLDLTWLHPSRGEWAQPFPQRQLS